MYHVSFILFIRIVNKSVFDPYSPLLCPPLRTLRESLIISCDVTDIALYIQMMICEFYSDKRRVFDATVNARISLAKQEALSGW